MIVHDGYPSSASDIDYALQLHPGPHLQASPQAHLDVLGAAVVFWHPHLQAAPAQDAHAHFFALLVMIVSSFFLAVLFPAKRSFSSDPRSGIE
jgi:hypothetical protein